MLVVDETNYKMSIYEAKKEVHVQILGFLKPDFVEKYMKDLQETIATVQKNTYTFVIDATYQSPLPSKLSADLRDTILFYNSLGFKDMAVVNPKSKIANVQIRNALETIDVTLKVVNHVSETTLR